MKVRTDSRPLYLQAEEALKELLLNRYQPGDRLPPEPELALSLGISRSTLRETMRSFEERGLISRRQGVGTFVIATPDNLIIENGLETLESLDSLARRKGLDITERDVVIEEEVADSELAKKLGIRAGDAVVAVVRTKLAKGRPVAHIIDLVPSTVSTLEELRKGFKGSVLDYFLERGIPPLAYASARIIPTNAGKNLSIKLDVPPQSPLLLIEETLYAMDNEPFGFSKNYFVPGHFGFHVIRRTGT